MRERLQRRKKKTSEEKSQPAPPPLQPAYFDQDAEARQETSAVAAEPDAEAQVERSPERTEAVEQDSEQQPKTKVSESSAAESSRGRSRRRRGGRGRGGRVREKAVAQAFAPAGTKGAAAEAPVEAPQEAALEVDGEADMAAAVPETPQVPAAPPRPPKGIVVLAIGLPGSGKSTWFKRHNITPLSSDMVRSLLFDDVREQRYQDLVFSNLRSMLKARLIAKRPMNYVDATNLTPKEREHWIKLAKDYNYEVHAVFFDVPLEVCIERHQRRDRVVPEDVMRRMAAKLKPPSFDEGFAKMTVVRVKKKQ